MKAKERQKEILKMLIARRKDSMSNIAKDLNVTLRTIAGDIAVLKKEYPIITSRGNNGGAQVDAAYHPYRDSFSIEQTQTLIDLLNRATKDERTILNQLIREFSSERIDVENDKL